MSYILIDGYNLIGIQHNDISLERERLIKTLSDYKKKTLHEITVVFDGWKAGGVIEDRTVIGGITVIFTRIRDKADSVIKRLIEESKRQVIVVSSDRDIASFAWSHNAIPIGSEEFIEAVRAKHRDDESEDSEEVYDYRTPKGGSKKKKAIGRALRRL